MGTFATTPQTTGPFNLVSYTPGVGAKYDRNPNWWGGKAPLDGVDVTFYTDDAAVVAALLGGQTDLVSQVTFATDRALFSNSKVQILSASSAGHREISMLAQTVAASKPLAGLPRAAGDRDDARPAEDHQAALQRVRRSRQRRRAVRSRVPVTDKTLPQRHLDLAAAKKLLGQAGYAKGFKVTLTAPQFAEIPQLAQILSSSVKKIGIDMPLNLVTYDAYYAGSYAGGATGRGTNPWLNSPIDITDWAHRSVPNVVLGSAFKTGGVWNAADYSNKTVDGLIDSFFGAVSAKDQKKYAAQIMKILQHDTPVIFPYFFKWNVAASKRVKGFQADALGLIDLRKTTLG